MNFKLDHRSTVWLVCLLIVASICVTYFTHQASVKIARLKERLRLQEEELAPLRTSQEKERMLNDVRWNAVLKLIQDFASKIRSKQQFLDKIKAEIKSHVLKSRKNKTLMAMALFPAAEMIVVEQQIKHEIKEGVGQLIVDTREDVKKMVIQYAAMDVEQFFKYDSYELKLLSQLDQEDPILVNHVRRHLWVTPSPRHVPYKLNNPNKKDRSQGQLSAFLDIFQNTTDGYYIECGAWDGEEISNSLDMEERYNWTGALIEASLINFKNLVTKKRKSILIPACLSLEKYPTIVQFQQNLGDGKIVNSSSHAPVVNMPVIPVHCMPFYTIYKALGRSVIDLFILDIEGHEVEVMHTIPWDKVNILVLIAEFSHGKYRQEYMRDFMFKQGYRLYNGTKTSGWPNENYIFIKKGSKYDVKHP